MSDRPFLFPVPGRVVRDLLDVKAALGDEFTDDEAATDLMLDLDLVEFYGREPQPTGMLHAVRYYAQRWSWTRTRVSEAWSGRAERTRKDGSTVAGVDPWIRDRTERWRAFYDEAVRQRQTTVGQRQTKTGPEDPEKAARQTASDSVRQPSDKQEQTYIPSDQGEGVPAGAREGRPTGEAYEAEAVAFYELVTGEWPQPFHAEAVARRFEGATPDELTAWAEHVTTYHASPTRNARNVPGIIQTFDKHLARTASAPGQPHRPHAGADPRAAGPLGRASAQAHPDRRGHAAVDPRLGGPRRGGDSGFPRDPDRDTASDRRSRYGYDDAAADVDAALAEFFEPPAGADLGRGDRGADGAGDDG